MAADIAKQPSRPEGEEANDHPGILGRFIPYFRNPENVLKAKTDATLLVWVVLAGIMKELDQTATTQAYVSGMREDLELHGNELVWFQTYFSISYAITIIPSQMLQSMVHMLFSRSMRALTSANTHCAVPSIAYFANC